MYLRSLNVVDGCFSNANTHMHHKGWNSTTLTSSVAASMLSLSLAVRGMARKLSTLVDAVQFQQNRGGKDEEWAIVEDGQLTLI